MFKKKVLMGAFALLGVTGLLAGCSNGAAPQNNQDDNAKAPHQMEVLFPFPVGIPFAPVLVAQEEGYFADNNIEVTTVVADGSGYVAQQLVAGNVEFAVMSSADAIISYGVDEDTRVIFCHQVSNVYRTVALKDSGVTSIEDLKGKTIGFTEPGGGEAKFLEAAIAEAGLTNDVRILPIGEGGATTITALTDGTVVGYSSSYPAIVQLGNEGIEFVDITPEKYNNVPGTCVVTSEKVLNTEVGMEKAIGLAQAWVKGQYYAIENPEKALDLACEINPSSCENRTAAEALYKEALRVIEPAPGHKPGELNHESWETMHEILVSAGISEGDLDITPLISGPNVEKVIAATYTK